MSDEMLFATAHDRSHPWLKMSSENIMHRFRLTLLIAMSLAAFATGCSSSKQETFTTPQAAVDSLVTALRTDDTQQLKKIFGPDSRRRPLLRRSRQRSPRR